eukprot:12626693-Ditylum_brightwellii.AAC.1
MHGKPMLVPNVKKYEEEKDLIGNLRSHAKDSFRSRLATFDCLIAQITGADPEKELSEICVLYNAAIYSDEKLMKENSCNLGQWFSDYLMDNGYHPHISSFLIKEMIISAFPPFTQDK